MLSVKQLNHFYGESHTLWDLSLEVPEGACVCVMGRNGVGKTTLLKMVAGELRPLAGGVAVRGTLGALRQIAPEAIPERFRRGRRPAPATAPP